MNSLKRIHFLFIIFIFLSFLSIHTFNEYYLYIYAVPFILYLFFKNYISSFIAVNIILITKMNIWLLYLNLFYEKVHQYTICSDIFTVITLSFLTSLIIGLGKSHKIKIPYIYILCSLCFLYKYCPYNLFIYYCLIFLVVYFSYHVINISYDKELVKYKYYILILLILVYSCKFLSCFKHHNVNNIAILKSEWCDVSKIPSKDSYEMDYYYSYSNFFKILKTFGNTEIVEMNNLLKNIKKYELVILITPTKPISLEETTILKKYVYDGGRLVFISDHTNLYGHRDCCLTLFNEFKIKMNDDALFDSLDFNKKGILNLPDSKYNTIPMKTGNTIIPSVTSTVWAITPRIISEKADYTKQNFFGSFLFTPDDVVGNFPIGISTNYGKGQFVIWNDSTLFSNFAINQESIIDLLNYLILGKLKINKKHNIGYKKIYIGTNDKKIYEEAPVNSLPYEGHFSTLLANFTRYGCFPIYDKNFDSTIYFTTYKYFINHQDKIKSRKIVIIDDIPDKNIFRVKKYRITDTNDSNNYFYSQNGMYLTNIYKNKSIFFAKNIISDNEIGSWWNNTTISPYKKYIIKSFFDWLNKGIDIQMFSYPKTNKVNEVYKINYEDGSKDYLTITKKSIFFKNSEEKIIYIGDRKWVFVLKNNKILGCPEMVDDVKNLINMKYIGERIYYKPLKRKYIKNINLSRKYSIGGKNCAP